MEDGIIDIPGYKYVGFLDKDDLCAISIRNEEKSLKDKTEVNLAYLRITDDFKESIYRKKFQREKIRFAQKIQKIDN